MGTYTSAIHEEGNVSLARAWPRFWARIFDLAIYSWLVGGVVGIVIALLAPTLLERPELAGRTGDVLVGLALLPLALCADALVIAMVGSSPGKAMAGLYVAQLDQTRLEVPTALRRNMLLYFRGLILGLPLICLIGFSNGFQAVKDVGKTSWDEDTNSRVYDAASDVGRTTVVAVFAIIAIGIGNYISRMP